jgi:extracellular factor (EF) 3-hydroxypalmitic acid methyl ester biosynthesis protein
MSKDTRRPSVPPRPSSQPPRYSSRPPPPLHTDFVGGVGAGVRFRPVRIPAAELPVDLACRFRADGFDVGPLAVLDLGPAGFAATAPSEPALPPGSAIDGLELLLRDRVVWSGAATVVHGSPGRIGVRFDSGTIDLRQLHIEATFDARLLMLGEQRERLPAEWRARVSDLRQLLEDARLEVERFERAGDEDPLRRSAEEGALLEGLRARWGAEYYDALSALHEQSKSLDERARVLASSYAESALMPLLSACHLHRRAYEKPLGYAGDYRLMEFHFADERIGDGLFGRFLFSIAQGYTLTRTVVARELVTRTAIRQLVEEDTMEPARVLSVAAGPAIELRHLLGGSPNIVRPVEFLLLDQDDAALETAHRHLTRLLLERHHGELPVTVTCLHFSIRQLLKPTTPEEREVVSTLEGLDLIYSAGLYDYLPDAFATWLTRGLYAQLRGGGRLLLGNMVEAPDTTWLMDYVLDWPLYYRTDASMWALAAGLSPPPASTRVVHDATGHCVFLDVARPGAG